MKPRKPTLLVAALLPALLAVCFLFRPTGYTAAFFTDSQSLNMTVSFGTWSVQEEEEAEDGGETVEIAEPDPTLQPDEPSDTDEQLDTDKPQDTTETPAPDKSGEISENPAPDEETEPTSGEADPSPDEPAPIPGTQSGEESVP